MDQRIVDRGHGFITYPSAVIRGDNWNAKKKKYIWGARNHVLFGDYVTILKDDHGEPILKQRGSRTYYKVRCRSEGFLEAKYIQFDRTLELNFVDVGQGDGCHMVTPDDEHYIIDAGLGDNMFRFLSWRFNIKRHGSFSKPITAVVTHPDSDHYGGFNKLFGTKNTQGNKVFNWKKVYHNGLVEKNGSGAIDTLGRIVEKDGRSYVTDLIATETQFKTRADSFSKTGNYINYMEKVDADRVGLKLGSPPIHNKDGVVVEVLGPVTTKISNRHALPVLDSNKGQTKNGHSVILKLTIGKLRVLLGGDLNAESEKYLFQQFTETDIEAQETIVKDPDSTATEKKRAAKKIEDAVKKMRKTFGVDIAKSCHHGSGDFTADFLEVLNPVATIISSGDNESHCHPRPETLGTIGKHSRGERSLIFSTELSRSSKEFVEREMFSPQKDRLRTVTVYGMIVVRTDGDKTIIATKLEKPRSKSSKWQIYQLEYDTNENAVVWLDKGGH